MPVKLYINLAASSPKNALVLNDTQLNPVPFPDLVLGDTRDYEVRLVDGSNGLDASSGGAAYSIKAAVGPAVPLPTGGTFILRHSGNATAALDYNVSASDLQSALQGLASIGSGNCVVTGLFPAWRVEFVGTLANTNVAEISHTSSTDNALTPRSTVSIFTVTGGGGGNNEVQAVWLHASPASSQESWTDAGNYWTGTLSTNTVGCATLLGNEETVNVVFEIELTDPSGNRRTILQAPAILRHEQVDETSLEDEGLPSAYTQTEANNLLVRNLHSVTQLTGGDPTDLDGQVTAGISTGQAVLLTLDGQPYVYRLNSGTTAESIPLIVRPDDYAASTNEKVWTLQPMTSLLFTATAQKAVTNTASETSMIGTGSGSLTLPAEFFHRNRVLRFSMTGTIESDSTPPTLQIKLKLGSTIIAQTAAHTPADTSSAARHMEITGYMSRRSTGASAVIWCESVFQYQAADGNSGQRANWELQLQGNTINTNTSQAFDITATWGSADPDAELLIEQFILEAVN